MFNEQTFTIIAETVATAVQGSLQPVLDDMRDELISLREKVDQQQEILECLDKRFCNHTEEYTCGGTGGWRRAVYLDMTDLNTDCPPGWSETDYSKRTCGRESNGRQTCDSTFFPITGGEYGEVCGRMVAYQWGWTTGFGGTFYETPTVDSQYFSGVAVMHGSPREHIWTFVAGRGENWDVTHNIFVCPCDKNFASAFVDIPAFVGHDYFCESGYLQYVSDSGPGFLPDDPLWDGQGCDPSSTCCSFHNPPYFTQTLAGPTTDDLELRLCNYFDISQENVAVELVELYIK